MSFLGLTWQFSWVSRYGNVELSPTSPCNSTSISLTSREIDMFRLLADSRSTTEIANFLFINVATVRNHIQSTMCRLEVYSCLEAVSLAQRMRLI